METPNLTYIKELSGGDIAFEKKIWNVIQEEFPQEKEKYYKSLEIKNQESIIEIVHKLKHKISILGLEKSYKNAMSYEENLRTGSSCLETEFKETLSLITSFLALH